MLNETELKTIRQKILYPVGDALAAVEEVQGDINDRWEKEDCHDTCTALEDAGAVLEELMVTLDQAETDIRELIGNPEEMDA